MGQLFGGRWRWLGRPAFLACVVMLALNDHVLKQRFPGWWTGKLSDVAGVALVGTLVAVVLGARRGLVVAGFGFTVLKAVPGVADAAAPVLGGVTARDRSDLLALGVLVPLGLMLRSSGGATAAPVGPVGPGTAAVSRTAPDPPMRQGMRAVVRVPAHPGRAEPTGPATECAAACRRAAIAGWWVDRGVPAERGGVRRRVRRVHRRGRGRARFDGRRRRRRRP
jgi:hypothetical protein